MNEPKFDKEIIYNINYELKNETLEKIEILTNVSRKYGFDGYLVIEDNEERGYFGKYEPETGDLIINFSLLTKKYRYSDNMEEKLFLTIAHELGHATDLSRDMYMKEEKLLWEELSKKKYNKEKIKKLKHKCEERILSRELNAYENGKKILEEYPHVFYNLTGKNISNEEKNRIIVEFSKDNAESLEEYEVKFGKAYDKYIDEFIKKKKNSKKFKFKKTDEYKECKNSNKKYEEKVYLFEKGKNRLDAFDKVVISINKVMKKINLIKILSQTKNKTENNNQFTRNHLNNIKKHIEKNEIENKIKLKTNNVREKERKLELLENSKERFKKDYKNEYRKEKNENDIEL